MPVTQAIPIDDARELAPVRRFGQGMQDRARMGHDQYGRHNLDLGPVHALRECGPEIKDAANYWSWGMDMLCPPEGRPWRIYIAGPIDADTQEQADANVAIARQVCAAIYRMGHIPFCPHAQTAGFRRDFPDIPRETYLRADMHTLDLSNALLLLPYWWRSSGTRAELARARALGIPVYRYLGQVPEVAVS